MNRSTSVVLSAIVAAITVLTAWSPQARAAAAASDNACNAAYSSGTWAAGDNGGSGFNAWTQTTTGGAGFYTGNSATTAGHSSPGIPCSSAVAWGMYSGGFSTSGNSAHATRTFTSANGSSALQVGQTFSIDMDNGGVGNTGNNGINGFSLQNNSGQDVFSFKFIGNSSDYSTNNTSSGQNVAQCDQGYTSGGLRVQFTMTTESGSTTQYTVKIFQPNTAASASHTYTSQNTIPESGGQAITQVILFNSGGGSGGSFDLFFNNLSITCPDALTIGSQPSAQTVCAGSTASFTVTISAGDSPTYQWRKNGTAISNGATGNGSTYAGVTTATLSISSAASGDAAVASAGFDCVITDACGTPQTSSRVALTVNAHPSITTSSLPNGTIGNSYTQTISASGGTTPYTFSISSGSLPTGLTMDSTGAISGTYSGIAGTSTFTVQVQDNSSTHCTGTQVLSITEVCSGVIALTPSSLPNGTVASAYGSQTIAASGGSAPYTFTVSSGTLPAGLALNSSSGVVSGTPTSDASATFTIKATDSGGCFGTINYTVSPACPTITVSGTPGSGTVGSAYSSATFTASGANGVYSYSVGSGALPTGLTLSTAGVLSGTPTAGGTFTFAVMATDSSGCAGTSASENVTIGCPAIGISVITLAGDTNSLPFGLAGTVYSSTNNVLAASGGAAPYSFSVTSGSLPAGMTMSTAGVVSGTPTTAGTSAFTVTVTDADSCQGSAGLSITVGAPAAISSQPTPQTACSGSSASFTVTATGSSTLSYLWRKNNVGWGASNVWSFNPTGCGANNGYYIGSSTACGGVSPGIGTTYGLYANSGSSSEADRNFSNLQVGQSVVIDYQNPRDMSSSGAGTIALFALRDASGTARFEFYFNGGDADYTINDSNTVANSSGIPYTMNGLQLTFTLATADTYNLSVSNLNSGAQYTYVGRTLGGTTGNALSQLRFYYRNSGGGGTACQDFFFNILAAGGYSDNGANYSAGACGSSTWTNGANAGQGPLSNGGSISGASTATLTLSGISNSDSGSVYSVIVYNPYGAIKSSAAALNVNATPIISTASLPGGTTGTAYSQTIAATSGTTPYSFSITGGSLPVGLTMNGAGHVSGTPTASGTATFTVSVTDSSATLCSSNTNLSIAISCPTITVSPGTLPAVSIGAPYNQTAVASGGATPYTYAVSSGSLPSGLTLNSSTGAIAGTYTGASGTATFTITATDANGCMGGQSYTVQMITCPAITVGPGSLSSGTVGSAYSQTITASGGTGPYTFSEVGTLPAGISLNSSTGVLSGTPSQVGTFNGIVVTAIDTSTGCGGSQTYSLVIGCQGITVTINGAPGGSICAGMPVILTASSSNSIGLLSYAWTKNSVPIASTQSVTDYPAAGNPNYVVTVTDTNGCTGLQNVGVIVNPGVDISGQPLPQAVCSNSTASFTVTASGSPTYAWQKIGSGWGNPWSFSPVGNTGTAGFFIGTSTNNGAAVITDPGNDPNIDATNHSAFGLYANSGATAAASRTLNPPLSAGQTFEIDVDNGDEPAPASVGFNLFTGGTGGTQRFQFAFRGGSNDYIVADNSGDSVDTHVPYTTQGLHVVLTMTSSSTYSLEIAPKGTNGPISQPVFLSGTLSGAAGSIDTLRMFNYESGGSIGDPNNPKRDAFFNSIQSGALDDDSVNYTPSTWTNGSDRGDAPLANGATGSGSTVAGADTSNLTISHAGSADVASYDVVVYNLCGTTNSAQAALTISATSPVTITAPSPVCGGSTNSASVPDGGVGATYVWTIGNGTIGSGQGTTGLVFVAGASGTVSLGITVTNASGCVSIGSTTVTVNPLPAVSVNSATICSGVSTTLTATTSAASPIYLWSPGGATSASINVSPGSTTTYTVTVTDGTTGCANSGSGTVTVNPLPTVSVNSATICSGVFTTLTATTSAASPIYLWSPGGATSASINVSPGSTTTYTVMVTDGITGCTNSGSGTVTVNPLPTVSVNSATICSGVSTTLTATTSAASPIYLWSPGGATSASINVSPGSTTTYTVTVTDGTTGCANSSSGTVTVNAGPVISTIGNNGPILLGGTVSLTATSATAISYSWTGPNSFTSSAQDPTIANATAAASGLYTVTVADGNGCTANASTTVLVSLLRLTGISKQSGNITISWTGDGGSTDEVQFTSGTGNGSYSNNFTDIPASLTVLPGSGAVNTNYVDLGGDTNVPSRYYRVRLVP